MHHAEIGGVPPSPTVRLRQWLVNGASVAVELQPGMRLLDVVRESLGLTGTKEGCGRGECGACTVLIDGRPVVSCLVYAETVTGTVTTIEGLAADNADLRTAFADSGAFQCGFCTPGQIVRASALLKGPWPSRLADEERFVRHGMSGNICRCTGYTGIVEAVISTAHLRAAKAQTAGDGA
jgi:aerobic-type carbon monoxide dehydrogenase small subunit (CoxS/CutS family)